MARLYPPSDQVGNAVSDHPRLAASGPGKHQERALNVLHGFTLRVGQAFQEVIQAILSGGIVARGDKTVDIVPKGCTTRTVSIWGDEACWQAPGRLTRRNVHGSRIRLRSGGECG
jgi:hypothetical protein